MTLLLFANAFLVQTSGLKVDVSTASTITESGHQVGMRIYKPKKVDSDNPTPAVAFMHGLSITKKTYTQYAIELSRRGFVVAVPDMLNHGDSDISDVETFFWRYES